MSIALDTKQLDMKLRSLKYKEIPAAMRHALNDLAFDTRSRIVTEIQRVFDRPTPVVQKLPRVKPQKSNDAPKPELWLTDYFNNSRTGPSFAVTPHLPGEGLRKPKGLEIRLRRMGLISEDQWMMPTRAAPLDQYGNMRGSVISKMIADLGAYNQYAGDAANTGSGVRRKSIGRQLATAKKYVWAKFGATHVIALKTAMRFVPMMIVVNKAPRYAPRFRFREVAMSYANRRAAYHAEREVEATIARRYR
jgi:hypothetical protein